MVRKKKSALEAWIDEKMQSDPDFKRRVQETLQGMRLKQETAAFFAERRKRADMKAFKRIMTRQGGEPPRPGDEV